MSVGALSIIKQLSYPILAIYLQTSSYTVHKEMYRCLLQKYGAYLRAALKTIVIPLNTVFTRISTAALIKSPRSQCGAYLSNYCNLQLKSLLDLGQNVITFGTLLHLGSFITFRPSTDFHNVQTY